MLDVLCLKLSITLSPIELSEWRASTQLPGDPCWIIAPYLTAISLFWGLERWQSPKISITGSMKMLMMVVILAANVYTH